KAGMSGSQALKFFVSAQQGSDQARWEVPQATTVTVPAPEMTGTADTSKKYKKGDKTTIKVQFKGVKNAKELLGSSLTCTMEAESMADIPEAKASIPPWKKN